MGIFFSLITSVITFLISWKKSKDSERKRNTALIIVFSFIIPFALSTALILMNEKYGIFFSIIALWLISASVEDIYHFEADDMFSIVIILSTFIICPGVNILLRAVPAFLSFVILSAVAIKCKGRLGGGDIKIISSLAFALPPTTLVPGLVIGLSAGIIINLIKKNKERFPLIPYISSGILPTLVAEIIIREVTG